MGSVREEIIEGRTGFLSRSRDPVDLARMIKNYFDGDLYKTLESRRQKIRDCANARNS